MIAIQKFAKKPYLKHIQDLLISKTKLTKNLELCDTLSSLISNEMTILKKKKDEILTTIKAVENFDFYVRVDDHYTVCISHEKV